MAAPPAKFLALIATSAAAVPLGHFMQLAVIVLQVLAMQPSVITSQMNPVLHAHAKLVPPVERELGRALLPHWMQP